MLNNSISLANDWNFRQIGWKYYNGIIKKAMEQEFSWSGLAVSLSIAFFIVISAASVLSLCYQSIAANQTQAKSPIERIYQLEVFDSFSIDKYIQAEKIEKDKIKNVSSVSLV